jgi:hypothetical protein
MANKGISFEDESDRYPHPEAVQGARSFAPGGTRRGKTGLFGF